MGGYGSKVTLALKYNAQDAVCDAVPRAVSQAMPETQHIAHDARPGPRSRMWNVWLGSWLDTSV